MTAHEFLTNKGVTQMGETCTAHQIEQWLTEFAIEDTKKAFIAGCESRNEEYQTISYEEAWNEYINENK